MPTAAEISHRFCDDVLLPMLRQRIGTLVDRIAIGISGTGSDVLGLDDEISRDHHWGPRAVILLNDEDFARHGAELREVVPRHTPSAFEGFAVHHDLHNRTGVCVDSIGGYLEWFLGTSRLPERDEDWFTLCETDLLHVTAGAVFHDPSGRWTGVRQRLAYYPDRVWRKRIADWCMYLTGRDAPYNLHRVSRRGDEVAAQMYLGSAIRRVLEMGFLLNRRYAPYPKWQWRLFRTLPRCAPAVVPLVERTLAATAWRERVDRLIEINHLYAGELHAMGLTAAPGFKPFDDSLTDLILYESAAQLYAGLSAEWRDVSFNGVESWEKLARRVLFDPGDYFQTKFGAR